MLISIIIPTYNRADLLPRMIRSIFQQSYEAIEIVIVDDGSTDKTEEAVQQLIGEARPVGMKIRYFRQDNAGAPSARNHGIRQCTGQYIMFADSDDSFCPDGIKAGMDALLSSGADYAYLPVVELDSRCGGVVESKIGFAYDESDHGLLDFNWHTMGAIYSRAVIEKAGYWNEALPCSQDWEFQIRVKLTAARGCFVDVPIGVWNVHGGDRLGVGSYKPKYVAGVLMACESIRDYCAKAGRLTDPVKIRLFRRLARHALECGANGEMLLRSRILNVIRPLTLGVDSKILSAALRAMPWRFSDIVIYRLVQRFC